MCYTKGKNIYYILIIYKKINTAKSYLKSFLDLHGGFLKDLGIKKRVRVEGKFRLEKSTYFDFGGLRLIILATIIITCFKRV